ncbi:MAG: element excision factor XisH family protein [Tychonema bourrellyi B0820]|uniref:Fatty-acid synthase n=1 Tax=Tychonema bourrellyi FEM_GT703 TaxID=2040638 RepID=A0A2G4F3P1_9CYAN|nr:element excision factor XisH family protein [Tychonema bourrellyi]MDQ2097517.1 element excision factor XisH family protein [Tychonema bourrellyi B0820]PHX56366.1 fatty-acid synthase [Tychonema bourrellyi FEM_GT703]
MPAKDIYYNNVRTALEKDGWTITNDPLPLKIGKRTLSVDLGAEKLFAAEKQGRKIAVKVKSLVSVSPVYDLEEAVGQYIVYEDILEQSEPERIIYLAIRAEVYGEIFSEPIGQVLLDKKRFKLIVFDSLKETIVRWID